jgi:hypothetical protein
MARLDKDKMACNKPKKTPSHATKSHVVKACEGGQEKIVRFGQQGVQKNQPDKKKSFNARHKCDQKKSKLSAGYWSCKAW